MNVKRQFLNFASAVGIALVVVMWPTQMAMAGGGVQAPDSCMGKMACAYNAGVIQSGACGGYARCRHSPCPARLLLREISQGLSAGVGDGFDERGA